MRSRFIPEAKLAILAEATTGKLSKKDICLKYRISKHTFLDWKYKYDTYGLDGLIEQEHAKSYSQEFKLNVVEECLEGKEPVRAVARKYGLSDSHILRRWIKQYNGHREQWVSRKGRNPSMTKRKSTTWIERIEITEYCIAIKKDYQRTMDKYSVSYHQIHSWVRKYQTGGPEALRDGRGRTKDESELTTQELQNLAIKRLEAENLRLRAENDLLKKLKELERGGY